MNKIFIILLVFVCVLFLFGCIGDEGKFDTSTLPELKLEQCDTSINKHLCNEQEACILKHSMINQNYNYCEYISDPKKVVECEEKNEPTEQDYPKMTDFSISKFSSFGFNMMDKLSDIELIITGARDKAGEDKYESSIFEIISADKLSNIRAAGIKLKPEYCERSTNNEEKEMCLIFAQDTLTKGFCESLNENKGVCMYLLAIQNKDASLCKQTKKPMAIWPDCEDMVIYQKAYDSSDASLCQKIEFDSKAIQKAISGNYSSYFTAIMDYSTFATCVLNVAHKQKNTNACKYLEAGNVSESFAIPNYFFKEGCQNMDFTTTDFAPVTGTINNSEITNINNCKNIECVLLMIQLEEKPEYCEKLKESKVQTLEQLIELEYIHFEKAYPDCYHYFYNKLEKKEYVRTIDYAVKHALLNNESACENIQDELEKSMCYSMSSIILKDKRLCEEGEKLVTRYVNNNYSEENTIKYSDEALESAIRLNMGCTLLTMAMPENNPKICLKFSNLEPFQGNSSGSFLRSKINCLTSYAILKNDVKTCMGISQWDEKYINKQKTEILKQELEQELENVQEKYEKLTETEKESLCSNDEYDVVSEAWGDALSNNSSKKLDERLSNEGDSALSGLEGLDCLTHLDLRWTNIADVSALSKLKNLETLELRDNKIKDITPLFELKKLKTLYVEDNELNNLEGIENLQNLETLWVGSNQINNIEPLKNLNNLKSLSLTNMKNDKREKIKINTSPLKNLSQLEELSIDSISAEEFDDFKNIKSIDIDDITQEQVNKLPQLKNLEDLTLHSLINDLSPLEKINNLETITLDIDSQQYFDKFSELKIDLKEISLNDSIDSDLKELNLSKLNNFKNLEDLTLSINKFSNFDSIKNLSGLKKFSFYSYVFDDLHEGYFSWDISPLKKLETLRITYYPFAHGYGLNKIKNLESLSNLKNMHISSGILFEQCVSFKENNPNINIRCSR